jgi:hypothetical protein
VAGFGQGWPTGHIFSNGGIVNIDQQFLDDTRSFYDETDRNGIHNVELQAGPVFVSFARVRPYLAARWHDLAPHFGQLAPLQLLLVVEGVRKSLGDDRIDMKLEPGWDRQDPIIASRVSLVAITYSRTVAFGVDLLA